MRVLPLFVVAAIVGCSNGNDGASGDGGGERAGDAAAERRPGDAAPDADAAGGDAAAEAGEDGVDLAPGDLTPADLAPADLTPADLTPGDLAPADGADRPAGPVCDVRRAARNVDIPVLRFEPVEDGPAAAGQTTRVRAWVVLPGDCVRLGRTFVSIDAAERAILVRIEGWEEITPLGPCSPGESSGRVVAIHGVGAGSWTVYDRAVGSTASLPLAIAACESGCLCRDPLFLPDGSDCRIDCECASGTCIVAPGGGGACRRSCGDDDDCPAGDACVDLEGGPVRVCRLRTPDECATGAECPPGEECECLACDRPAYCAPRMPVEGDACCEHADCAPGQRCIEYFGFAGTPFYQCLVPCRGGWSCPPSSFCGDAGDGPSGVCFPSAAP